MRAAARWVASVIDCKLVSQLVIDRRRYGNQGDLSLNDREQVVEIVRDPSGQSPDRFHLL